MHIERNETPTRCRLKNEELQNRASMMYLEFGSLLPPQARTVSFLMRDSIRMIVIPSSWITAVKQEKGAPDLRPALANGTRIRIKNTTFRPAILHVSILCGVMRHSMRPIIEDLRLYKQKKFNTQDHEIVLSITIFAPKSVMSTLH